uniref:Uncharacterized protein n=1 Tax=Ciona savignyi TaxID=51511 RepID=H2ZI63_CIOSA
MTNETLPDSWFNISAETKLENRIVSHHSVDVSEGNSLAVAAGKAVVIGSFRLYDEHQKTDCNFALENVPIKSNAPKYDVGIETHLQEFEARCNLTSNVSGHPDYALYKVLLDPTLSQEGSGIYNEYDVVRFSPTISTKFNNECYLATITLDNRCSILSQSCVGVDR